ncbi:MAG: PilZ domain-containing protein [Desulfobacterales bacterium]
MTVKERRKHPRFRTNDPISYVCIDNNGNRIKEGKGKAANVSKGGILIETQDSFNWQDILLLGIDLKDKSVSVKGRVVYSNTDDSGMVQTGIEFLETGKFILTEEMTIEPWKCPDCGQTNDGLSTHCIRCGYTEEAFIEVQRRLATEHIKKTRKQQKKLILTYLIATFAIIVVGTFLYLIGVLPRFD